MTPLHALAFTAGILIVLAQSHLPEVSMLTAFAIPALLPWKWRPIYACAVFGVLLTVWRSQTLLDQRWPESRYGEEVWVQGYVASLPDVTRSEDKRDAQRAEAVPAQTIRFLFETDTKDFPPRIRASWYRSDQILKGGECWRLQLRMRPPHGSVNPGGFDYEGFSGKALVRLQR